MNHGCVGDGAAVLATLAEFPAVRCGAIAAQAECPDAAADLVVLMDYWWPLVWPLLVTLPARERES